MCTALKQPVVHILLYPLSLCNLLSPLHTRVHTFITPMGDTVNPTYSAAAQNTYTQTWLVVSMWREKKFGEVRFGGAGAGCGVRVRITCGAIFARTPNEISPYFEKINVTYAV